MMTDTSTEIMKNRSGITEAEGKPMSSRTYTRHPILSHHRPVLTVARAAGRAIGVWRQRRSLAQLDDHLLEDLGLTRAEAEHEARRALWDVPASWRR